jgi:predicted RNase H-like HicB family nuclease
MKEYVVIFEWAETNYSAYVPDLPGCISTGKTMAETEVNIREAIELYIEILKEDDRPIPPPAIQSKTILVQA